MIKEPYIVKQGEEYRLRIANNLYSSPCQCKQSVDFKNNIHFHHSSQGFWNPRGNVETFIVNKKLNYPNG